MLLSLSIGGSISFYVCSLVCWKRILLSSLNVINRKKYSASTCLRFALLALILSIWSSSYFGAETGICLLRYSLQVMQLQFEQTEAASRKRLSEEKAEMQHQYADLKQSMEDTRKNQNEFMRLHAQMLVGSLSMCPPIPSSVHRCIDLSTYLNSYLSILS